MKINTEKVTNKRFEAPIKSRIQNLSQEYKVLALLRYLYPNRFETMVAGEAPDLQDAINDVGIEVTIAVKEDDMKASRVFAELYERDNIEIARSKISSSGFTLLPIRGDSAAISIMGTSDGEKVYFQESIRKKMKKLQRYRRNFKKVGLAILLPEIPTSYAENCFSGWVSEVYNESESVFDFVYVLSHRFCICYDAKENVSEKRLLTDDEYSLLSVIARMTAEGELSLTDSEWL